MAYGGLQGQAPQGVAPINGLPTNDVRELTVRSGYDISAGDVVDVEGGEVFKRFVANPHKIITKKKAYCNDEITCQLNDKYFIYGYIINAGATWLGLMDSEGAMLGEKQAPYDNEAYTLSIDRMSDSRFVIQRLSKNKISEAYVFNVTNTTINLYKTITTHNTSSNYTEKVISFTDNYFISFVNNKGLQASLCKVDSGNVQKRYTPTSYSVNNISACHLPDDEQGNKRIFICYWCGDSPNTRVEGIVATFNVSTNEVSFGSPKTIYTVGDDTAITTVCSVGNNVVVSLNFTDNNPVSIFSMVDNETFSIKDTLIFPEKNATSVPYISSASVKNNFIIGILYSSFSKHTGKLYVLNIDNNKLSIGNTYQFTDDRAQYIALSDSNKSQFLLGYRDDNNSTSAQGYETFALLEVQNNQIAGSFTFTSKDAIALQSGTSGQPISVGFGGYCPCDGIVEGQTITSSGVMGYGVKDGWLDVRPEYEKSYEFGSYIGNGKYGVDNPNTLTFSFAPSMVHLLFRTAPEVGINAGKNESLTGEGYNKEQKFMVANRLTTDYRQSEGFGYSSASTYGKKSADGKTFYWYSTSMTNQCNTTGTEYYYIAFR